MIFTIRLVVFLTKLVLLIPSDILWEEESIKWLWLTKMYFQVKQPTTILITSIKVVPTLSLTSSIYIWHIDWHILFFKIWDSYSTSNAQSFLLCSLSKVWKTVRICPPKYGSYSGKFSFFALKLPVYWYFCFLTFLWKKMEFVSLFPKGNLTLKGENL